MTFGAELQGAQGRTPRAKLPVYMCTGSRKISRFQAGNCRQVSRYKWLQQSLSRTDERAIGNSYIGDVVQKQRRSPCYAIHFLPCQWLLQPRSVGQLMLRTTMAMVRSQNPPLIA